MKYAVCNTPLNKPRNYSGGQQDRPQLIWCNTSARMMLRNIQSNNRHDCKKILFALLFLLGFSSHRSEEHTSELQSLMRISYAVFCLKKKIKYIMITTILT